MCIRDRYNSTCQYKGDYGIWQFTDALSIGGKNFDGNWAYKDYPALTSAKPEDDDDLTYEEFKEYMERHLEEMAKKPVSSWAMAAVNYVKQEMCIRDSSCCHYCYRSRSCRDADRSIWRR